MSAFGGLLLASLVAACTDAKADSLAVSTTSTTGASAPLATCTQSAECAEIYAFGGLGADAEKTSCEARGAVYAIGSSCSTDPSLVGTCARDQGGLHKKVYSYEVNFDRGSNRVQAAGLAKRGCESASGTWTDAITPSGGSRRR